MFPLSEWLTTAKPHPAMADIKQVKKVISELCGLQSVEALERVSKSLNSICDKIDGKADRRFQLIDLLDQAGQFHQRKISEEYVSGQCVPKSRENALWVTASRFSKLLSMSYNQ